MVKTGSLSKKRSLNVKEKPEIKKRKTKKVRFAKDVETKNVDEDFEDFGIIGDSSENINEEELDDEEKEFLEHTKRGESYPVVRGEEDDEESSDEENFDYNASMDALKEKDPEFYDFLLKHDKNLVEIEQESEEHDEDEDGEDRFDLSRINEAVIEKLSDELRENGDRDVIVKAINLFKSAIEGSDEESSKSKLQSAEVLNSIIRLCLVDLLPAIHKFLKLPPPTASKKTDKMIDPSKTNKWKKLVSPMKIYLTSVVKVFDVISESSVIVTVLRHCLYLIPFFNCYVQLMKRLLKKAIQFWSEGEEKVRVLSFLIVLRLMKNQESEMLSFIMKKLYISYINNCKFTNAKNWPLILFMRQSLVELYSLDQSVAYNHAFVFTRQCAINLRNAMMAKQKDSFKAVFNWQYAHSLLLWAQLVSSLHPSDVLSPLIHPLTQVMIGTIRLHPVAKNVPLRVHLVRGLIQLSDATDTFIPVLPLITEILEIIDVNHKPRQAKSKKCDFDCIIKVSKQQVYDKQFIDNCVNKFHELLLEYLSTKSHSISFPELVFVATVRVKRFMKSCKNAVYCRLLKQAVDKINENSKFIEESRRKMSISISDVNAINAWEAAMKEKGTPLSTFYSQLKKLRFENKKREKEEEVN